LIVDGAKKEKGLRLAQTFNWMIFS
jgi:hypothetical protein